MDLDIFVILDRISFSAGAITGAITGATAGNGDVDDRELSRSDCACACACTAALTALLCTCICAPNPYHEKDEKGEIVTGSIVNSVIIRNANITLIPNKCLLWKMNEFQLKFQLQSLPFSLLMVVFAIACLRLYMMRLRLSLNLQLCFSPDVSFLLPPPTHREQGRPNQRCHDLDE